VPAVGKEAKLHHHHEECTLAQPLMLSAPNSTSAAGLNTGYDTQERSKENKELTEEINQTAGVSEQSTRSDSPVKAHQSHEVILQPR